MSSKKNGVLIKWKTNDRWYDCEQAVPRKTISPKDGALRKGQHVKILFGGRWSPGEISLSWQEEQRESSGIVSFIDYFIQ